MVYAKAVREDVATGSEAGVGGIRGTHKARRARMNEEGTR